ncbi:hypothetical protein MNB_SUP05-SYMBIONT-4-1186 [hydrothermal vent metagenome]|uniref:Transposase InsH N-terminal domain-containing protein n=1 Tax=hydrothermal vent metagenome TaxID=652676 RepID=A0A1W1DWV5_9ZZZZ
MDNTYKKGKDRQQTLLFPPNLDDLLTKDNPVRGIDSYVDTLDVFKLGFNNKTSTASDGASAFHPALLLKIYIYGYTNKIRSSRALEKEIKRNIEMMWLCKALTPSHTTIANFRKNNAKALKKVFKEFVLLCQSLNLIGDKLVALDGAFLRANASKNQLLMHSTITKDINSITLKIEDYLTQLETADKHNKESDLTIDTTELIAKTTQLKNKKLQLEEESALLEKLDKKQ